MTIDEQLRDFARHADEHQGAITVDEIVQRASGADVTLRAERHTWRHGRSWLLVAAAAIAVIALAVHAMGLGDDSDGLRTDTVSPDGRSLDIFTDIPPGSTVELPPGPLSGYGKPAVVWTGTELIVWGGVQDASVAEGAAFNPSTSRWRVIAPAPIEDRTTPLVAWTGTEMLVVGGEQGTVVSPIDKQDGAAYNPATDTWRSLPNAPINLTHGPTPAWTGDEIITVGAAYSPETDEWRRLAGLPDDDLGASQIVWTGDTLLVRAAQSDVENTDEASALLRYDLGTDEWQAIGEAGCCAALVAVPDGDGGVRQVLALPDDLGAPVTVLDRAGNVTGTLPGHPGGPALSDPVKPGAWWTGDEALFSFGTLDQGHETWTLDPETGTWRQLDADASPTASQLEPVTDDGLFIGWGWNGDGPTPVAYRAP